MILPEPLQQVDRTWVNWRGQTLAYFAGCDYFRMASHPEVLYAAHHALQEYGLNVAASRWTTGNHPLYNELEEALAEFFGIWDGALLVSNGFLTNSAVVQGISDEITHILIDERAHSSLALAAKASDFAPVSFKHRDVADLRSKIPGGSRPLIMTDGVFAQDGSIAPLAEYANIIADQGYLLVDDSHGAGVLGKTGKGTPEHCGVISKAVVQTITLSKALGSYGGAIIAPGAVLEGIAHESPLIAGATPFPLPCAAAALASLRLVRDPERRQRLRENIDRIFPGKEFPIHSVDPADHEKLIRALLARGIFPPHIRYGNEDGPAVGFFRFAISSEHSRAQLDALAEALTEAG